MNNSARQPILLILPVIFCGVYFHFCYRSFVRIEERAQQVKSWTKTPCTVTKSYHSPGYRSQAPHLSLEYEYVYDGTTYHGTNFGVGQAQVCESADSERFAEEFPAGSELSCYVDPDNPADAVMNPDVVENPTWILKIIGAAGLFWLFVFVTNIIPKSKKP